MCNLIRKFLPAFLATVCWSSLHAEELQFTLSENVDLMSEDDAAIFHSMVELALDSQPDGYVLSWENPESGANGNAANREHRQQRRLLPRGRAGAAC